VAIIDSGIDASHPDLEGCVDAGQGVAITLDADGNVVEAPGPHEDAFGHGTACAGIIHGIAPEARMTSVRVLGPGLTGRAAAFLGGLAWAVEREFDIINLSLGTTRREWALAFYEICDRAYFGGSFITTAANNFSSSSYPSLFASVASVACNLSHDPLRFHYNPQPPTEFLARGIDVEVAWSGGGRIRSTGNSYAAPHISGVAALIRSKHPDLRPFQIKTVLWATAANVLEAPRPAGRLSARLTGTGRRTKASARMSAALRL
jgi:subtilisin